MNPEANKLWYEKVLLHFKKYHNGTCQEGGNKREQIATLSADTSSERLVSSED
jgi:hypothetical protein